MQGGDNSHSLLNGRFQRMDIPSTSRGKSPCFDRRQPPERRQTPDMGSIEKLLAPGPMQTPEKINILGMKTAKDMKVLGVNRAYDKPSTSGMMQHPETKSNPEIILVSEVISGYNPKNIAGVFDANQLQPKELHAEIHLDRPGPSGVRTVPEFQQRMDVMGPPTAMSAADSVVSPGGAMAQGEKTQRSRREIMREILSQLSSYTHGIPYPITKYYLESAGFNNFSPEMVQLVGLTAQKYIYDILVDAMQNSKERMARESAERGGTSAGAPLTLTYDDLAPALKKYKENKNINYMKNKDSILASFRKLLNERNSSYNDDENDIAIAKIEQLMEKIDQYSHTGNNQTNLLNNESNESGEESMSESKTDESQTDTSTSSRFDLASISSSNATNAASLSSSSPTDDDTDVEDIIDDEDDKVNDVENDEIINNNVDDDDEIIDDDEDDDNVDVNTDDDEEDEIDDDDNDDDNDMKSRSKVDINNDDYEDKIDDDDDDDDNGMTSINNGDVNNDVDYEDEIDDDDHNGMVSINNVDINDDVDDEDEIDDDDENGMASINGLLSSRERREVRNILTDNLDRPKRRVEDLINILRNTSKYKNSEGEEDECDQFGAMLAEKLKKLSIQHGEEIMSEIDSLLLM